MKQPLYIVRDIRRNEYFYLTDGDDWSPRRGLAIEFSRYATAAAKGAKFGGWVIEVDPKAAAALDFSRGRG